MSCFGGDKEEKVTVYDASLMYFDEYGNIRHSGKPSDRDAELKMIMMADKDEDPEQELDEDGKPIPDEGGFDWHIIDTAWLNSWLAYAHYSDGVSPRPGPCDNTRLIVENHDLCIWEPREDMVMATATRGGRYRRISQQAWEAFVKLYPGSGPTIVCNFMRNDPAKSHGRYDTSLWRIDKEYVKSTDKKKKKKKEKEEKEKEKKEEKAKREEEKKQKELKEQTKAKINEKRPTVAVTADPTKRQTLGNSVAREADSDDDVGDSDDDDIGPNDSRIGAISVDGGAGIKMTDMKGSKSKKGEKIDDEFVDDLLFG